MARIPTVRTQTLAHSTIVLYSFLPALGEPSPKPTSESLRVNLHPSRARSAQMGIVVHILAEFQQMHYICLDVCRFADWSGSCTPSSKYTTM